MINIEELCKNYKIFVDTSSFMVESAGVFFHQKLYPSLLSTNSKVIIPDRVYQEIIKLSGNKNADGYQVAQESVKILNFLEQHDLVDRRGEENEVLGGSKAFADPVFKMVFTKFQQKYNLCLITQDKNLATDILNIKNGKSVNTSKKIEVAYISFKSNLGLWEARLNRLDEQTRNNSDPIRTERQTSHPNATNDDKFKICNQPTKESEKALSVASLPKQGDYVNSPQYGKVKLTQFISAGGEGEIFETDANRLVCKIYREEKLTNLKKCKLELMLSKSMSIQGVCWPKDIVVNLQNQFVGYLMNKAQGHSLQTSVFVPALLKKKFPDWKREHLVQLAITVAETFKKLHDRNIIVGDINPNNILVVDENNVFFVDVDSYQVEDFPCPVGTINFTAPELQGKNFPEILRTEEHELFAMVTLIFMILFPGKPPYSSQGGGDLAENIKNKNFPYVYEEGKVDTKPFGTWRFIWSHLHRDLKNAFGETFQNGNQVPIEEYLEKLKLYLYGGIKKGFASNDLFPSSYKVHDGVEVKCTNSTCRKQELVGKLFLEKFQATGQDFLCLKCRTLKKLEQNTGKQQNGGQTVREQAYSVSNANSSSNYQNVPNSRTSHTQQPKTNQKIPSSVRTHKQQPQPQIKTSTISERFRHFCDRYFLGKFLIKLSSWYSSVATWLSNKPLVIKLFFYTILFVTFLFLIILFFTELLVRFLLKLGKWIIN
ncbi:hypothetical protein [Candidatus Parabeggiatoa sp. HSG14]|uniref:hypothetical protein n=1 Tax=Candidatus Parabeggiatoa sp. HSG14 TaxID=3055593 RepID=UPI0025A7A7B8|nr:hypothetical protein [Thiotrichales bacterium HSG14]